MSAARRFTALGLLLAAGLAISCLVVFLQLRHTRTKAPVWEYKIVRLEFAADPAGAEHAVSAQVQKLAAAGWEYAGFHLPCSGMNDVGQRYPSSYVLFKRPKKAGEGIIPTW